MFQRSPYESIYPCQRETRLLTRRDVLGRAAAGFGGVALAALMANDASSEMLSSSKASPMMPRLPHFAPKARSIIFLYMDGGPSQVDTFDPKPYLTKNNGRQPSEFFQVQATQFNNNGALLGSPWKFRKYGECGLEVSDLFPHVAECADDLCVIRSMTSEFSEHTNANYLIHTGLGLAGRPSMGAWTAYGLGAINDNLPSFVVLNGGLTPPGGLDCFGSGFLSASYQGSVFRPGGQPVANIHPTERAAKLQTTKLSLMRALDKHVIERAGSVDQLESAIANYELAYRMQSAVPDLMDISDETEATKEMYGIDHKNEGIRIYGGQCLTARRLVERGVRFIELTCPSTGQTDRWDQHSNLLDGHSRNSFAVDQPIAALLKDLKQRGLLDETLVIWSGEFGRTPFAQGTNGRDHNPYGFTTWMAGGGVKGGITYGETDEFGNRAVTDKVEIYDLHATMLNQLGFDHTKLTFRFSGRDMRLTDVHGHVVHDILA